MKLYIFKENENASSVFDSLQDLLDALDRSGTTPDEVHSIVNPAGHKWMAVVIGAKG